MARVTQAAAAPAPRGRRGAVAEAAPAPAPRGRRGAAPVVEEAAPAPRGRRGAAPVVEAAPAPRGRRAAPVVEAPVEETAAEMSLEEAVVQAVGTQPARGETRQDYLARIVQEAAAITDPDFEQLEQDVQDWLDAGSQALIDGTEVPEFEAGEEVVEEVVEAAPAPRGRRGAAAAVVEEAPAAPAPRGGRRGGTNGVWRVKQLLCEADYTVDQLEAKLAEEGVELTKVAITQTYNDWRTTVQALQDAGLLTENII